MIEKSLRRDHRLSSLCKPHDAKWLSSGRILLSYPHTHDIFLNYTIPILGCILFLILFWQDLFIDSICVCIL